MHAKLLLQLIESKKISVTETLYLGKIGNTEENLKTAFDGETAEYTEMYVGFEKTARDEGFKKIADTFKNIAISEKSHAEKYASLLANFDKIKKEAPLKDKKAPVTAEIKADTSVSVDTIWVCTECGFVHKGSQPPAECPLCGYGPAYFNKKNS